MNQFQHKPLKRPAQQVRLLSRDDERENAYRITVHHIDRLPSYTALSYTWGVDQANKEITLDDRAFRVCDNLFSFLQLQVNPSEHYWIDQICIDQLVVSERNQQVALMGTIYTSAAEVVIWLGHNNSIGDVVKVLEGLDEGDGIFRDWFFSKQVKSTIASINVSAITQLFAHGYWNRIWIIQEILLARRLSVAHSSFRCSWKALSSLHRSSHWQTGNYAYSFESSRILWLCKHRLAIEQGRRPAGYLLQEITHVFRHNESSDPRDRIYGLQAITLEHQRLQVDYNVTIEQLLWNFGEKLYEYSSDDLSKLVESVSLCRMFHRIMKSSETAEWEQHSTLDCDVPLVSPLLGLFKARIRFLQHKPFADMKLEQVVWTQWDHAEKCHTLLQTTETDHQGRCLCNGPLQSACPSGLPVSWCRAMHQRSYAQDMSSERLELMTALWFHQKSSWPK